MKPLTRYVRQAQLRLKKSRKQAEELEGEAYQKLVENKEKAMYR